MTTRLEDLFGLQSEVASYLHAPDLPALKETTHELCSYVSAVENQLTFYGATLPNSTQAPLFYDLFHQRYDSLEARLRAEEDLHIDSPYREKNAEGKYVPSRYRATIHNKRWNNMTLMEVAYMLGDFKAYQLLTNYNRTTAQKTTNFNTTYTDDARNLLLVFGETKKEAKLRDLRPHYSQ
jgi:hypothetical protein